MKTVSTRRTTYAATGTPLGADRQRRRRFAPFFVGLLVASVAVVQGTLAGAEPTAVDVTFASGAIELAGTLTLPAGPGPHPALVTITGSGPQDHDNAHPSIPGYRPFAWLAEHLREHGVAVMRSDEREVGESGGEFEGATSSDFAGDVEAALANLWARPDAAADRVGLVGHSEGSMIAGMITAHDPAVAFVISFAEHVVQSEIRAMELTLAEDWDGLEGHLFESFQAQFGMLPEEGRPPAEQLEPLARQTAQQAAARYADPWFRSFLRHAPGQGWERVSVPVLVAFAEHDLQVDPELNRTPLREAFERAGNEEATIVTLERANHQFLASDTGDPIAYAELEMAFTPGFLGLVTQWLAEHVSE